MPVWMIVLAAFVLGVAAVAAMAIGLTNLPGFLMRRRIERRMKESSLQTAGADAGPTLVKAEHEGPLPRVERALGRTRGGGALNRLIEQSGSRVSATGIVFASLACAIACGVLVAAFVRFAPAPIAGALLGLTMPFLVLRYRGTARMKRFEEQFPEALDLLSRAIRAGHAFTTAMGMVATEAPDPIGPEFRKTYDEQNYGLPMKEALNNMASRVRLLDVRFFVTAVLIQRDTGGNLAEILDNLAYVVRERFKVLRQVRVYTAHGRFTSYVLIALPPSLAAVLMLINPEHMGLLFTERLGHMLLTVAVVLQIIGIVWLKKVIKIEV